MRRPTPGEQQPRQRWCSFCGQTEEQQDFPLEVVAGVLRLNTDVLAGDVDVKLKLCEHCIRERVDRGRSLTVHLTVDSLRRQSK